MHIALLEDDQDQSTLLKAWLEDADHNCTVFASGKDMTMSLLHESFDLLILDWLVPDMNGLEVLQWVRDSLDWRIPVLFITQKEKEEDVVQALQGGADDYMSKPVKRAEMLARIYSISRRSQQGTSEDELEFIPYTLQRSSKTVKLNGENIEITRKEFELTLFLFRNAGRVLSRGYILETVWGRSAEVNTRTVDTHVSRLRRKLIIGPENGWKLTSIYQHGYRLEKSEMPT
ncbi:MAG: response regulator transcription factor [Gammaproteobacteria bacterium]|nr:response regulator transcription factor [Gammaproteobacteria bacterium]